MFLINLCSIYVSEVITASTAQSLLGHLIFSKEILINNWLIYDKLQKQLKKEFKKLVRQTICRTTKWYPFLLR